MRLYKNKKGQWFGTKLDAIASRHAYSEVDVPTSKKELLDWLNANEVGAAQEQAAEPEVRVKEPLLRAHRWQTIMQCAQEATFSEMGMALSVLMNRLEDAQEGYENNS